MKYAVAAVLALAVVIAVLAVRLTALKKELRSINSQLEEILKGDTNALITVSTNNKAVKETALALNEKIRELRKKELQLKSKNDELRTAITNISHDLRTPLTAICGYLDLLKSEEKSDEVNRCLGIIENRTEALKQLTEEFFKYSLVAFEEDELKIEELSVNGALEESIAAFYGAFKEKGIEPQISITDRKIIRSLDKSALLRIFANILSNALKYSDGDLEITLNDGGKIIFTNTASGLDEIQVGKIFDRFYTVENARISTGLGLSIARSLAERMGGKISASYGNEKLSIIVDFGAENAREAHA
ncbi:MAG: sensor histidine kinase [Acutalibacteraceae bacterium]